MRKLVTPNFGAVKDPALQTILRMMHANIVEIPANQVHKTATTTIENRYAPSQDYQRSTVSPQTTAPIGLSSLLPKCSTHNGSTTYDGTTTYCSGGIGYFTWTGTSIVWKDEIYGQLSENNTWAKGQRGSYAPLTSSSASIAVDLELSNNFSHTLTEDTTLAAPTNAVDGQSGIFHFTQHAIAAKTLAFNAFWYFGSTTPTISATLGAKCAMSYIVEPGAARAICSMGGDLA